jgi:hypothetical protein
MMVRHQCRCLAPNSALDVYYNPVKFNILSFVTAGSLIAALAGCGRDDVRTYRVPKETQPPQQLAQAQPLPADHPDISGTPARPAIQAKAPAGWEEAPLGAMRVASYRVKSANGKTADISVVPLGGMAGRDLDNVNRWRGQIGLKPIGDVDLAKLAEAVQIGGQEGKLYEMVGQNADSGEKTRMLAAIVRRGDTAWFFKILGEDGLVSEQKPAFVEYLQSFTFPSEASGTSADATLPPSHPPIGNFSAAPATASAASSNESKPQWQVPAAWKEIEGGGFLVAKFIIGGSDSSQAAVNVSSSAGDGGGVSANVNRWRGQLGLNPLSESEIDKLVTSVDINGGKAMLVDMTGADVKSGAKARLIAAIVPRSQQTWFFKLMGPSQLVDQQKDAFTNFVKGVKYP